MVKLDSTLAREIRKTANGDGTRDARFQFLRSAENAAREMSTPEVMDTFDDALRKYGRATVAVCVAATIERRQDRLEMWSVRWAQQVMNLWTNRPPSGSSRVLIDDGLHPCRIEDYAGGFIKATTIQE